MHTVAVFARQLRIVGEPPRTLPWLRQAVNAPPRGMIRQLDPGFALWAHHIAPLPFFKLLEHVWTCPDLVDTE